MKDARKTFWDKCVKGPAGDVVLGQPANAPIIVAVIAAALSLIPLDELRFVSIPVALGSLFTWGWGELFDGLNYFRRALGLGSLIMVIIAAGYLFTL